MKNQMLSILDDVYIPEAILKETARSCVCLLRNRTSGSRSIGRIFVGSTEVYEKLQEIHCSNLPAIEYIKETDGFAIIVEEYIQGDTLDYLLEHKPLQEEYAIRILRQVCQGLRYLHAAGAVHRDIKPGNIILRGDEAVLIDFDASRLCKPTNTTDTQIMGTTGYAAPEQYGLAQTDSRTDIYALGVLLNVMLTRQHPATILAEGPLRQVIETCTATNVDQRYGSVNDLLLALEHKPKKWLFPAAAIILAASLMAGIWISRPSRPSDTEVPVLPAAAEQEHVTETVVIKEEIAQTPEPRQEVSIPKEEPAAEEAPEPEPVTEEEAPEETSETEPVLLSQRLWDGDTSYILMDFRYDIDADGSMENYIFSPGFYIHDGVNPVLTDGFLVAAGNAQRKVVPVVWKVNESGVYEIAKEFASLLKDPHVTIYPGIPDMSGEPAVAPCTLDVWSGGVQATFTAESAGTWFFVAEASLDGEKLEGIGICYPKAH